MHSYFIFLTTSDGDFIRINICCGIRAEEISQHLKEFWDICERRLKELRKPWRMGDMKQWRVIQDICNDPVEVDMDQAVRMCNNGAWKLSGEFPGRVNVPLTTSGAGPAKWSYGDEL